ncbi:putative metallo-hydrolase [Paraconexibacter sp. AEG42_29]|uniref:Metallo-hydrolase n=1 Tax=Paraconexibacter sp. AEG42_29 TaxID=2997339 RepID=A0AAU7AUY6_9ACTN
MASTRPIHHLDCGTMCPHAAPALGLVDRAAGHLVAHCLLIEGADGLVLIDTGYGTGDIADPRRLGPARLLLNARLDPAQTAVAQVRALGHDPADVRHVLVTHLDLDHAGGLGDFPNAEVHLHAPELTAARARKADTKLRYRPRQWEHGPRWAPHAVEGEAWFGFEGVRLLPDVGVELVMIPLAGHTLGHTGYAVNSGDGWLLHCGDAYLRAGEIALPPVVGPGLKVYHRLNSAKEGLRRENVARLAELARDHAAEVTVFCSHDPTELAAATA